jgi:SAM-dependent methyltransferase
VKDTFDQIAPGWYNFRRWQRGRLLNLGCAHGPDFLPFRQEFRLCGIDFSTQMLQLARKYAIKFDLEVKLAVADVRCLPFPEATFDRAMAVATYHHLKTAEDRRKAWQELNRVLKPGGEAFITVWNRWQPRFWLRGKEVTVPWRTGDDILHRYYYLFSYRGLEKLAEEAGFAVLKSFPESAYHFPLKSFSRNICLLVKKV